MTRTTIGLLSALLIMSLALATKAAVPQLINYQGRLTNSIGEPLDTTVALIFQICADSNGVTSLWDETHASVAIAEGLFQVLLGSVNPIGQSVFDGQKRWLGVRLSGGPATTLLPIVSSAYAFRSNVTDTAALAKTVSDNAITSAKIQNGTIQFGDIGQNSATANEVIKWNGSAWEAQADATGSNASGWVDNGNVVNLITATDTVALNTTSRLGKLNVNGDLGMTGTSSIKFGSDANRITAMGANDLRLVAEDLSMLTTGDITFGEYGVETWIKFDNINREVGIGTLSPDERLQVENGVSGGRAFLQLETSHATSFGETGIRFKTPQNTWHLRMDDYTSNNLQDGALGLRSQVGVEAMTWLESGNVGIGTTSPTKKLHVYGSALVKDTLHAGAINPSLMAASRLPDEPGVASNKAYSWGGLISLTNEWQTLTSRQITVPAPGYILAFGHAFMSYDHTYGDFDGVSVGISDVTTGVGSARETTFGTAYNVGTGLYSISLTPHAIFEVDAADTYTYYLLGMRYDAVAADVYGVELILLYVPTSYGTVSTAKGEPVTTSEMEQILKGGASVASSPAPVDYAEELRALRDKLELLEKKLEETKN